MAKLAITILVFRVLQLVLGLAFLVFWTWSCATKQVVGGGIGEYVFGYVAALLSLAICIHGIWSFAKKQHLTEHRALYHNARWAIDLALVCIWLGNILIQILVEIPREDASEPILVVLMGVNITELFSAITLFMTSLLLIIPAVKARKIGKSSKHDIQDAVEDSIVHTGVQAPQAAYIPEHSREHYQPREERGNGTFPIQPHIQVPQAAYGRQI